LYGGTIQSVTPNAPTGSTSGDSSQSVTIVFTASVANPVLAWGGHIATRADWGANNSAVAISGSPYHMRLISLNGSGGNQDRSLAAASILPIPASFDTAVGKSTVVINQPVTDTATLSGANGPVSGSVKFFVCGPTIASNPDC